MEIYGINWCEKRRLGNVHIKHGISPIKEYNEVISKLIKILIMGKKNIFYSMDTSEKEQRVEYSLKIQHKSERNMGARERTT